MITTRFGQTNSTSTLSFQLRTHYPLSLRALAPAILSLRFLAPKRCRHFLKNRVRQLGKPLCILIVVQEKETRALDHLSQFFQSFQATWHLLPVLDFCGLSLADPTHTVQHCRIPFQHWKVQVLCMRSLFMSSINIPLSSPWQSNR